MQRRIAQRWTHPKFATPRYMRDWLTDPGSLTAKLKACFPDFRVHLVYQGKGQAHHDECATLHIKRRKPALIRDVVLMSGNTPLVYAHSAVPQSALRLGFHRLSRQGTRPLGATLFANPRISRGELSLRRIDSRHALWREAEAAIGPLPPRLWARRSCFSLGRAQLLVTEVFLSQIDHPPFSGEAA